jgi:hypothetical protein
MQGQTNFAWPGEGLWSKDLELSPFLIQSRVKSWVKF